MSTNVFFTTALQCHHEVHQSASPPAQCTHAQPHCERAQLDGFSPGILPRLTGLECCRDYNYCHQNAVEDTRSCFQGSDSDFSQVLRGDLKPAIETHEMLYQVTKQHKFLPEVMKLYPFVLLSNIQCWGSNEPVVSFRCCNDNPFLSFPSFFSFYLMYCSAFNLYRRLK